MPRSPHVAFLGGPGVTYEEWAPAPELAPFVAVHWRIRASVPFDLRIPPDGCMDVIDGDVVGSFSRGAVVPLQAGEVDEGIRFHPGGFPALFGIPASELVDQQVPLRDLIGPDRSLVDLVRDARAPDPLARATYAARDLAALRLDVGYGDRQLRRRVLAATGHSPKRLIRIARMQRVLKAGRGENWARTAAEFGFYDEAHMVNDVRDLVGATPHTLLG